MNEHLLAPACYAFLIHCGGLPPLSKHLAEEIERVWGIDDDTIERLALRAYPTKIQNLIASHACTAKFGDLARVGAFYRFRGCWWLDLDEKWCRNGFLMPIIDARWGWISSLVAFRHTRDQRPFPVQLRAERRAA